MVQFEQLLTALRTWGYYGFKCISENDPIQVQNICLDDFLVKNWIWTGDNGYVETDPVITISNMVDSIRTIGNYFLECQQANSYITELPIPDCDIKLDALDVAYTVQNGKGVVTINALSLSRVINNVTVQINYDYAESPFATKEIE